MSRDKAFLQLEGVSLKLDGSIVLRDIAWTFSRGQQWAVIGPNGSGKTLLARAIAGELPLASGEIRYGFGMSRGRLPEDRIALVSFGRQKILAGEDPAAIRWFALEQEASSPVSWFLSQDRIEEINPFEVNPPLRQSRTAYSRLQKKVVRLLEIEPLLNRRLPSLSNGEMRKVILAQALLKKPQLLIIENVFTGLDSEYREHLRRVLERLLGQGAPRFVLTSADPASLPRGITHVLCLDRGAVIAQGKKNSVLKDARVLKTLRPKLPRTANGHSTRCTAGNGEELVRMENVSVRYGRKTILSGINWTVRRGESWALTGPNGSGKSTLLSLINGDNPQAYSNAVYLFGRRRGSGESVWDLKKRIGWVSPELHLHFPEDQTCYETVLSGFRDVSSRFGTGNARQRAAAREMLSRFGLAHCARVPFGSVSEGVQRMVLLARALVKAPDLLLLDEPCQGLDIRHREAFLCSMESLMRGTVSTIIYVSHLKDEIPLGITKTLHLHRWSPQRQQALEQGVRRAGLRAISKSEVSDIIINLRASP